MQPRTALLRRAIACLVLPAILTAGFAAPQHPLDPLDENEILTAAFILLDAGAAAPGAAFQGIDLREPPKDAVLDFQPGDAIPRAATVFFRQNQQSYRTVVNLLDGTFTPPVKIPQHDGQLGLTIGEILDFAFLFENADFLAALALRGIDSPDELAHVFVTPLTPGSFGLPEETKRIVKAQMYYVEGAGINLYARPIEGLQAIVDLDAQSVIKILDTGVVPVPVATHEFDEASVEAASGLRPALKPIRITQPEGVNFTTDGQFIAWQKWRFHVRFERRSGTVLSLVTYDGRSVLYQGALSEVFVPYQDPGQNWFYRTFMDVGEFGFGTLASPLAPGLDVPENAALFGAVISAAIPDPDIPVIPLPLENVVGVFERVTGHPEWRHFELFAPGGPRYEGRAEVELVVRMIAQVGNYDYAIDWVFTQRASIRVDVSLTGIDAAKGVTSTHLDNSTAAADTAFGALVAPHLVATNHSHHFNFRLDLDIDGRKNSFALGELAPKLLHPPRSPRRSVWTLHEHVLKRERDLTHPRHGQGHGHAHWRVFNPAQGNAFGYPTSYVLESHGHGEPLMHPDDYARAGFIEHPVWITAYDRDEQYAAGDTPNQHPGRPGLPHYIKDNEVIADRDIVLWHTLSHHHVPAAEDYPVLPRAALSFELKPANFFDRNPALDLRRAPFEAEP